MAAPLGIDVHAHFFPERFIRVIEDGGAPFGGRVDRSNPVGPVIDVKRLAHGAARGALLGSADARGRP